MNHSILRHVGQFPDITKNTQNNSRKLRLPMCWCRYLMMLLSTIIMIIIITSNTSILGQCSLSSSALNETHVASGFNLSHLKQYRCVIKYNHRVSFNVYISISQNAVLFISFSWKWEGTSNFSHQSHQVDHLPLEIFSGWWEIKHNRHNQSSSIEMVEFVQTKIDSDFHVNKAEENELVNYFMQLKLIYIIIYTV